MNRGLLNHSIHREAEPISAAASGAYIPELDGLRGIAALMVVFYHGFYWSMGFVSWPSFPRLIASVTQFGWLGVDLFFVLSGFLITGVLLKSKNKPSYFKEFYARRALRILPVYYGILLVLELLSPRQNTSFVLISLIYLSNAAPLFGIPVMYGPLWSLSVEEHFYLIWPWLVSISTPLALSMISGGIVIAEPVVRLWGFKTAADIYGLSWFRFDGLALGAILALFVRSKYYSRSRATLAACLVGVFAIVLCTAGRPFGILTRTRPLGAALQATCAGLTFLACVCVVVAWSGNPATRFLRSPFARRIGDISYCLYVVHLLVFHIWDSAVKRIGGALSSSARFDVIFLRAMFCIGISCGIAALSRKYWEMPFLRLKRHFE